VMAHAQKPDLIFQRNGRVHLYRRGCQFSRLLAAEVCASAVVECWIDRVRYNARLLATPSIRLFPLHFSTRAFPCAITFHFCSTTVAVHTVDLLVLLTSTFCIFSHLQALLKYGSKANNVHRAFWDPKRLQRLGSQNAL